MKIPMRVITWSFMAACLLVVGAHPAPAAAQDTKNSQHFFSYVNTYNGTKLLKDPLVRPQLVRRMGTQLAHLERNLSVSGAVDLNAGMLTFTGNAEHRGLEEEGFLGVSLYDGEVYSCLLTNGRFQVYGKDSKYDFLPYAVRAWILSTWAKVYLKGNSPPNVSLFAKP